MCGLYPCCQGSYVGYLQLTGVSGESLCHRSRVIIPNVCLDKCLSVLTGIQSLCNAGDVLPGPAPRDVSVKHKLLPLEKELLILAASKPLDTTGLQKVGSGRGVDWEDL